MTEEVKDGGAAFPEREPEYWMGKHVRILVRALRDLDPKYADGDPDFLYTEGQATKIVLAFIDAFNSERRAFERLLSARKEPE